MSPRSTYHHGDLRAALVAAARALFAERGVTGVSIAEAARRSGVSGAAPYRHFSGRLDLLSAAATAAGRELHDEMQAALEEPVPGGSVDPVTRAVEDLAVLARVQVRFQQDHGAAFELILAEELQAFPDQERREVTRSMFDLLLAPAMTITGSVEAANPLLRAFTAVANGFAQLSRGGGVSGYPTDLRGFPDEHELVAAEAAQAVRTLARAAVGSAPARD
ncbi:TetR/AcrR family transcriptional regulator [Kineococcus sp. GCM10028916]|uniref:TetR/AcrR family transcriptional regulator n=1 Tax=Kineococcus sp. GCM10028916 TaxID=3273394 RepID=UPI00362B3F00